MELKLKDFEGFEGHVKMRVPTNIERYEILDNLGMDLMAIASGEGGAAEKLQTFGNIIKMIKMSEDFYVEVKLKKDKKVFKSFDDLNNDPACQGVMIECAKKSVMGLGEEEKK